MKLATPPAWLPASTVVAFDHVALGVWSIERALAVYRDLLGGVVEKDHVNRRMGFRFVQLRYPNRSKIEILEPTDPADEKHFLARFLKERGEGVHHLTFYVASLDAAVAAAEAAGLRVVGVHKASAHWKEAFIFPLDAFGTVVQFAETDPAEWFGAAE